ncbi:unnamed protein product [Albugo candida]|uniref:Uncharacterized protein n=1 Tax=Albugo candida TaxID=65357 RepID=A0A024GU61_9STRA|nr:unnamed protein product [Albugo candida]|eukprot:CCI50341.1 unnamed protein product [Albugo candida]
MTVRLAEFFFNSSASSIFVNSCKALILNRVGSPGLDLDFSSVGCIFISNELSTHSSNTACSAISALPLGMFRDAFKTISGAVSKSIAPIGPFCGFSSTFLALLGSALSLFNGAFETISASAPVCTITTFFPFFNFALTILALFESALSVFNGAFETLSTDASGCETTLFVSLRATFFCARSPFTGTRLDGGFFNFLIALETIGDGVFFFCLSGTNACKRSHTAYATANGNEYNTKQQKMNAPCVDGDLAHPTFASPSHFLCLLVKSLKDTHRLFFTFVVLFETHLVLSPVIDSFACRLRNVGLFFGNVFDKQVLRITL